MARVLLGGFATQAWVKPAGQAGGDFVVTARTAAGWRVVMGDVSGHGDEVALTTQRVRARIARDLHSRLTLRTLRAWNRDLPNLLGERFVCLTCLEFDAARGLLTVANAGNPAVLVNRANGDVDSFSNTGSVLGILGDEDWTPPRFETTPVSKADRILCFTDGLTEQFNPQREPFGLERVVRLVSRSCNCTVRTIRRCVRAFSRGSVHRDDVTVLLLQAA